jgi:hypothetical protein
MKKLMLPILTLAIAVGAASTSLATTTWDLRGDFASTNPNGAWTYGVYLEDGHSLGNFYAWPTYRPYGGSVYYYGNEADPLACGVIFRNTSPASTDGHVWLAPGDVAFFAGLLGWAYDPVIRWTATTDMTISVNALFTGQCDGTSDVHILLNGDMLNGPAYGDPTFTGTHLVDGEINGNYGYAPAGIPASGTVGSVAYNGTILVHAGDYIDFVSGYGSDHAITDVAMVGVSAVITQVPEPASLGLLCCALAGLLAYAWRKQK